MELTLEQVKQAGRFAYSPEQMFIDGRVWDFVLDIGLSHEYGGAWNLDVLLKEIRPRQLGSLTFLKGWHHLPGCDCEFCRPTDAL